VVTQLLVGAICMPALTGNCDLMEHKYAEALLTHVHQFYHVSFIASRSNAGFLCICCVSCCGSLKTLQSFFKRVCRAFTPASTCQKCRALLLAFYYKFDVDFKFTNLLFLSIKQLQKQLHCSETVVQPWSIMQ